MLIPRTLYPIVETPSTTIALDNLKRLCSQRGPLMLWVNIAVLGLAVAMNQPLNMVAELMDNEKIGLALLAQEYSSDLLTQGDLVCCPWINDFSSKKYHLSILPVDHTNCRHFIEKRTGCYELNMMRLEECGMWFGHKDIENRRKGTKHSNPFRELSLNSTQTALTALSYPVIQVDVVSKLSLSKAAGDDHRRKTKHDFDSNNKVAS